MTYSENVMKVFLRLFMNVWVLISGLKSKLKDNRLAYKGRRNQRHASGCVMPTFPFEKGLIFLTSRKYVCWGIKVSLKTFVLDRTMLGAFNFNGCDKLEKNSFKNILAMKILVLYSSLTVSIALQLTSAWTPSGFFKNFR